MKKTNPRTRIPVMIEGVEHWSCTTCVGLQPTAAFGLEFKGGQLTVKSRCNSCRKPTRERGTYRRRKVGGRKALPLARPQFEESVEDYLAKQYGQANKARSYTEVQQTAFHQSPSYEGFGTEADPS